MFDYLTESVATNIVGSYAIDRDQDFKNDIAAIYENFQGSYQMDLWQDAGMIVKSDHTRNEYKQQLLGDVLNESWGEGVGYDHYNKHKDRISQLFENCCEEIVQEATMGQMAPIVGLTLPILKKNYYENVAKDIILTEVPDQPFVKLQFERTFLRDKSGKKYYVPDVFYSDAYKEVYSKTRGADLAVVITDFVAPNGMSDILALASGSETGKYSMSKYDTIAHDFCIDKIRVRADYSANKTLTIAAKDAADATAKAKAQGYNVTGTPVVNDGDATKYDVTCTGETVVYGGLNIQPNEAAQGMFTYNVKWKPRLGSDPEKEDILFGSVDFYNAKVMSSAQSGLITGIKFGGHLSNEKNENTVQLEYERESRDIKISDGERLNTGLTLEKIRDSKALLNIDITAKVITDMNEMLTQFEDNNMLDFLRTSYDDWKHKTDLPFGYGLHTDKGSFVETAKFSCIPPASVMIPQSQWIASQLKFNLDRMLEQLKVKINNRDMMFVVYGNPKNISLINSEVTWIVDDNTKIGGVQLQYKFGVLTNSQTRCHVVSSQKIRESEGIRIAAYPLTKEVITFKHFKYSMNIENTYRNPDMSLVPNIMATQRYKTFEILPIQGRFVLVNNGFGNMNPANIWSEEPGYYQPEAENPFNSIDDFPKGRGNN